MRRKIYKYPLDQSGYTLITTSGNPKVLSAGFQGDQLYVWIEQDERGAGGVIIHVHGTGQTFYLGKSTFVQTVFDGSFVWHVYQEYP